MEVGGIQQKEGAGMGLQLGQSEATGLTMKGSGDSMITAGPILCHCFCNPPRPQFLLIQQGKKVRSGRSHADPSVLGFFLSQRRGESFGPWVSTLLPGGWVLFPSPASLCEARLTKL